MSSRDTPEDEFVLVDDSLSTPKSQHRSLRPKLPPLAAGSLAASAEASNSLRIEAKRDATSDGDVKTPKSLSFCSALDVETDTGTDSVHVTLAQPIHIPEGDLNFDRPLPKSKPPCTDSESEPQMIESDMFEASDAEIEAPPSLLVRLHTKPIVTSPPEAVTPRAGRQGEPLVLVNVDPGVASADTSECKTHATCENAAPGGVRVSLEDAYLDMASRDSGPPSNPSSPVAFDNRVPPEVRSLFDRLERCLNLHQQDDIVQAKKLLDGIVEDLKARQELHDDGYKDKVERFRRILESNADVITIREEMDRVMSIVTQLKDRNGWIEVTNKKGIQTAYKQEQNTPIHSIKVQGQMESELFHVLTLINESDLLPSILPLDITVRKLKQISKFQQLLYMHIKLPFFFDNRDAVIVARGVDMLHDGYIVIAGHSVKEWSGVEIPPPPSGCTRLDVRLFGAVIQPLSKSTSAVSAICNLDVNMNSLPRPLLNFFSRHLAFYGFEMFRENATRLLGSKYEKRIVGNPEVYDEIQARVNSFFDQKIEAERSILSFGGSSASGCPSGSPSATQSPLKKAPSAPAEHPNELADVENRLPNTEAAPKTADLSASSKSVSSECTDLKPGNAGRSSAPIKIEAASSEKTRSSWAPQSNPVASVGSAPPSVSAVAASDEVLLEEEARILEGNLSTTPPQLTPPMIPQYFRSPNSTKPPPPPGPPPRRSSQPTVSS